VDSLTSTLPFDEHSKLLSFFRIAPFLNNLEYVQVRSTRSTVQMQKKSARRSDLCSQLVLQEDRYWRNVGFELEHKERLTKKVGWFSSVQCIPGKQTKGPFFIAYQNLTERGC